MKKNLICIFLTVTMCMYLALAGIVYAAENTKMTMSAQEGELKPEDTIEINLGLENVPDAGIMGIYFAVQFDEEIAYSKENYSETLSFTSDKFNSSFPLQSDGISGYEAVVLDASDLENGVKESGEFGKISIKTSSNVSGKQPIKISNIRCTTMDGETFAMNDFAIGVTFEGENNKSYKSEDESKDSSAKSSTELINLSKEQVEALKTSSSSDEEEEFVDDSETEVPQDTKEETDSTKIITNNKLDKNNEKVELSQSGVSNSNYSGQNKAQKSKALYVIIGICVVGIIVCAMVIIGRKGKINKS